MSLQDQLQQELTSAAKTLTNSDTTTLSVAFDSGQLTIELSAVEQLACAFTRLACTSDVLMDASIEEMKAIAERLSSELSYLLEPVSPIEIDRESCSVQLRSSPPSKDDDGTRYYELNVRKGELALQRYWKLPQEVRQAIPAEVTREVLVRLASDIVQAAN